MKAVRWHARAGASLDEIAEPILPSDRAIIVAVEACGVCGTDYEEVQHGPKVIPVGRPHPLTRRMAPLVMGHEILGRVVSRGARATQPVGQRVVLWPQIPCRDCPACRAGNDHQCPRLGALGLSADGGFASLVVTDERNAVPIAEELPLDRAVLVEPYAVALHAFAQHSPIDKTVAVLGIGSVGLALVETAVALGARRVIAVSRSTDNLKAALRAGAEVAVTAEAMPVHAADLAIDASGAADAMTLLAHALADRATAVIVGVRSRVVPAPIWEVFSRELSVVGSNGMRLTEFAGAAAMITSGRLAAAPRQVSRISLAELPDVLRSGPAPGTKIVAVPD
jgi:(R,R)-butanediol dehydrogenase / meso-butanediol dehydrogenase / diacetyl reductase